MKATRVEQSRSRARAATPVESARPRDAGDDSTGHSRSVRNLAFVAMAPLAFVGVVALVFRHPAVLTTPARAADAPPAVDPGSTGESRGSTTTPAELWARGREDPIRRALAAIRAGDFGTVEDVATGRLVNDYSRVSRLIDGVDPHTLALERRGPGWVVVHALSTGPRADRCWLRMRFVADGSRWKLDHVRPRNDAPSADGVRSG